MRILICGDRNWSDFDVMLKYFQTLDPSDIIIEGGCRGADEMARRIAIERGMGYVEFPADWDSRDKAAGPIRNAQMITEGKPDKCVAFHNDISKSKGTSNMIAQCSRRGIPVTLISSTKTTQVPMKTYPVLDRIKQGK